MRLTFRRLLAYLDGVLDEQDVEVVGQKISESKVASQLIHRIKNAKTRERLGAPRVNGTGMGLDPNTVAEYLDYTLDEERVPDFETVCFESDVHLAEVSASHEILTLVLAEPAQVERSIRERIYEIPTEVQDGRRSRHNNDGTQQRTDEPHIPAPPIASEPVAEADAMREVAEYLDERTEVRWRSLLLTAALSFLLVLVGLRAMGSFDASHPLLGRLLASNDATDVEVAEPLEPLEPLEPQVPIESGGPPVPEGEPSIPIGVESADSAAPETDTDANVDPTDVEPTNPAPPELAAPPLATDSPKDSGDAVAANDGGPLAPPREAPALGAEEPLDGGELPATDMPLGDPAQPEDSGEAGAPTPEPKGGGDTTPDGADGADGVDGVDVGAAEPLEVGLCNSPGEVICRFQASDRTWRRLNVREVVRSGDRLRVPPYYRPLIAFAGSLQVTVVGPADLEILPPVEGRPHIRLHFGRMIVESVATPNLAATLELGAQQGDLLLKSIDSTVAVSVQGYLPVGGDPDVDAEMATQWNAVRGDAMWVSNSDHSLPGVPLSMGQSLTAVGSAMRMPVTAPAPEWSATSPTSDVLTLAAESAEKEFTPARSMGVTLNEMLNHRMVDIRSLSTQSMSHFGNFLPFVRSLKVANREDNPNYFYRQHEYTAMRSALARGPEFGKALRGALEREFEGQPETVERLFRLCVSFDNQQLERGQAAQLIQDLSSEEQAIRILAFENLRRITGKKKIYNPLKSPDLQKPGIASWTEVYEAGGIRWAKEPAAF